MDDILDGEQAQNIIFSDFLSPNIDKFYSRNSDFSELQKIVVKELFKYNEESVPMNLVLFKSAV